MLALLAHIVLSNWRTIEGVLVAKKDYNAPKHDDLDVPNLQVIKAMQSLTSKGFVKTQFSWQYYYYTLTNEGLDYLREWYVIRYVNLPCLNQNIPNDWFIGSTSLRRSSPRPTASLHVRRSLQRFVPEEEMVHTVRPAVIGTITAVATMVRRRKRVPVRTSGHGTRVLGEVRPRSRVALFVDTRPLVVWVRPVWDPCMSIPLCLCEYLFCPTYGGRDRFRLCALCLERS